MLILMLLHAADNGELWCAGWNSSGQLGLEHREDLVELSRISLLPRIVQVDCGWNHTLALSGMSEVPISNLIVGSGNHNSCMDAQKNILTR